MGFGSGKKRLKGTAFILAIFLSAIHTGGPVWASERLADFSDMVRDLDAEAEAPGQNAGSTAAPQAPAQSAGNIAAPKIPAQNAGSIKPAVQNAGSTGAAAGDTGSVKNPAQNAGSIKPEVQSAGSTGTAAGDTGGVKNPAQSAGSIKPAVQNAGSTGTAAGDTGGVKNPAQNAGSVKPAVQSAGSTGTAAQYKGSIAAYNKFRKKSLVSVSELLLTAGAESLMERRPGADAPEEKGIPAAEKEGLLSASEKAAPERAEAGVTGYGGERLTDFASLVRSAEAEAGFTDSDPRNDPVMPDDGTDGGGRLAEFASLAGGREDGAVTGDSRLEEFALLAGEQGGDGVDARLVEFAEFSGGSSEIVDDRIVALAKVSDEREKEMEKKYGPRIEDNIISSPSDYKDGDRVVATANTRTETAGAYVSSGSWDKTEAGEGGSGIVKLFGSIYSGLAGGKRVSEDRDGSDSGSFSVSGFFTNIRDRVMSFVYSEEDMISLGTFSLTAYDACIECCGKTDGITATGTRAKAGRTIAVDPNVIPYGSRVMINGEVYIAEDTGSAIKGSRIDIYMNTHEEAKRFGRKSAEVYLLK